MGFSLGGAIGSLLGGGGNTGGSSATTSSSSTTTGSETSFSGTAGGAQISNVGSGTVDSDTRIFGSSSDQVSNLLNGALDTALSAESSGASSQPISKSTWIILGVVAAVGILIFVTRK